MTELEEKPLLRREWRIFTLLALAGATVIFFLFFDRFDSVGEPLVTAHNFAEWNVSGTGVTIKDETGKIVEIKKSKASDKAGIFIIHQLEADVEYLRVSGEVKIEEINLNSFFSGGAKIFLVQMTGDGQVVENYPGSVMVRELVLEWRRISRVIPVSKNTRSVIAGATIAKGAGLMKAKNISVVEVEENKVFSLMESFFALAWVIALIFSTAPLFKNLTTLRALTLVAGFLIITGTLMPVKPMSIIKNETDSVVKKTNQIKGEKPGKRKVDWGFAHRSGHFSAYMALALLALKGWRIVSRIRIFIYLFLFGAILELLQFFIVGRSPLIIDMGINVMGVLAGFGALTCWELFFRRRKSA